MDGKNYECKQYKVNLNVSSFCWCGTIKLPLLSYTYLACALRMRISLIIRTVSELSSCLYLIRIAQRRVKTQQP